MITVEDFNLAESMDIVLGNEVDGDTLAAKATAATNTVNVVFSVARQIVVDDERDLLDVNTTRKKVGRDEDTRRACAELLHDDIALLLVHVTVHRRDGKVTLIRKKGRSDKKKGVLAKDISVPGASCR